MGVTAIINLRSGALFIIGLIVFALLFGAAPVYEVYGAEPDGTEPQAQTQEVTPGNLPVTSPAQRAYIDMLAPGAIRGQSICGVFASVHIAVSYLETGGGKYLCGGNNYYGIKGSYRGGSSRTDTSEYYDGVNETSVSDAQFCAYSSFQQSQNHFINKMRSQYWAPVRYAETYQEACYALKSCGYATDPYYPEKLIDIINTHELWKYDTQALTSRAEDEGEQGDAELYPCRSGDCGANVEALQVVLDELKYNIGPCGVDGVYGQATKRAVMAFQREAGIGVDGIVGPQTVAMMEGAESGRFLGI